MIRDLFLIMLGVGISSAAQLLISWLADRPTRSKLTGGYRDARKPFAIVSRGPERGPARSEELIARNARRLHRIAHQRVGKSAG